MQQQNNRKNRRQHRSKDWADAEKGSAERFADHQKKERSGKVAAKKQVKQTEEMTLEESMKELDAILKSLDDEDVSLEDSFAMYQKGMMLLKSCNEKIDTVEKKILIMNGDGSFDEF